MQVPPGHVGHADGSRRAVQELVAVPATVRCSVAKLVQFNVFMKGRRQMRGLTHALNYKVWRFPDESSLCQVGGESDQKHQIYEENVRGQMFVWLCFLSRQKVQQRSGMNTFEGHIF